MFGFPGTGMMVLLLLGASTGAADARPESTVTEIASSRRYPLFSGSLGTMEVNQVSYSMRTDGALAWASGGTEAGRWPKGTNNWYMYQAGVQVAGIIVGTKSTNPWAGDTTGAYLTEPTGLRNHAKPLTDIVNAQSSVDAASWPEAARVPAEGDAAAYFVPELRGRKSVSQGDLWWMASEADPELNAARPHPLGIVAEYRVMGWNYPTGNEDLIYYLITFYNITSQQAEDYSQYSVGHREILLAEAARFKSLNDATFGISLPKGGYTVDPFYPGIWADPDVAGSPFNYASVNLPFAMGYAYRADFVRPVGWTFAPDIFGPPFFAGAGFVGTKYLGSSGKRGEIQLYTSIDDGGANSAARLLRFMDGTLTSADGESCNNGNPIDTHICEINFSPGDVRYSQSSTATVLPPGGSTSIAVSFIHAAPYQIPGYTSGTQAPPGDPRRLTDATVLASGANRIDSLQGFLGFTDANANGIVEQAEIIAAPGSLLGKAKLAQQIFDNKFLMPFAPDAPDFFLIPGDGQVTVVWRPSNTETDGDPFFRVGAQATMPPPGGGTPVVNSLYDPNYRQFDVEGYRIYRGRAEDSAALKLVAQYDYAGTSFSDYTGQVISDARGTRCAPEIGVTDSCAGVFSPQLPGVQLVKKVNYPIVGNFVQVSRGGRTQLASGDIINLRTDTAVVGGKSSNPALQDTGVPFIFVDQTPRNGLTYFYAVTAYDINSISSTGAGNTSLESALITKRIQPGTRSGNYVNDGTVTLDGIYGRGVKLTDTEVPTIDPTTGIFSKKMPPANDWEGSVGGLVKALLRGEGTVTVRLDSLKLGDPNNGIAHTYYLSAGDDAGRSNFSIDISQAFTEGRVSGKGAWAAGSADPELATTYGGTPGANYAAILGDFTMALEGGYHTGIKSRGCINGGTGFGAGRACSYNGPVWFDGEQQSEADPWRGLYANFNTGQTAPPGGDFTSAGHLAGVVSNVQYASYENIGSGYRSAEGTLSGAISSADYKVYWGTGKVDSVIDVTHNVPVPFTGGVAGTWGILNQSATTAAGGFDNRPGVLTLADFACVPGLKGNNGFSSQFSCAAGTTYSLSEKAIPGSMALGRNSSGDMRTRAPQPNAGIGFYLKGHIFMMELAGGTLPAAGTVWTMRDYVGAVRGGHGAAGNFGDYAFTAKPRPFTAVGAEAVFRYNVSNESVASSKETLAKVHTVPDPYYVTSAFEATTTSKIIKFVNLPAKATIRIYTSSGVLVRVLKQDSQSFGGEVAWDVHNRYDRVVASGVYFYHVLAENGETMVGRMTIINFKP